jgi:hypothetical protein
MNRCLLLCLASLFVLFTACSTDRSASVESAYESALAAEAESVSAPTQQSAESDTANEDLDVHFGLALQRGAAGKLIKRGLKAEFARALAGTPGKITIAGRDIPLRIDTNLADVQLEADDSCPTCVRITGTLAGRFDVDLPLVKEDGDEAYESKFSVIAPLRFAPSEDAGVILLLDTSQVARVGGLFAETKIEGLPSKLQPIAQKGLEKVLSDKLLARFEPIELVSFGGVDFGVEGMQILPAALSYDTGSKTIYAGVATNLTGIDGGVEPIRSLSQDDAMAVRYHLQLLSSVLALKMQQGTVERRYSSDGRAEPEGPARVIVTGLRHHDTPSDAAGTLLALDFDVYHFGKVGEDYRASATAHIVLNGDTAVVDRIEILGDDDSRPGFNPDAWKSATFLNEMLAIAVQTTSIPEVEVPTTSLSVGTRLVELDGHTITAFGGLVGLESTAAE